jgi:hypothetical protein
MDASLLHFLPGVSRLGRSTHGFLFGTELLVFFLVHGLWRFERSLALLCVIRILFPSSA